MKAYLITGIAWVFLLLAALAAWFMLLRRRQSQQTRHLQELLDLADRLEADLKTCKRGLQQAHAVMSLNPDLPGASEQDARHAVDGGLRALLQQRMWIRDQSAQADSHELAEAAQSMHRARERLQPLLLALSQAQQDLDSAMREHINRETNA